MIINEKIVKRSWNIEMSRRKALRKPKKALYLVEFQENFFFFLNFYLKLHDSEVYNNQLNNLNNSIKQKRFELITKKDVVFHHDNVRLHTNLMTR